MGKVFLERIVVLLFVVAFGLLGCDVSNQLKGTLGDIASSPSQTAGSGYSLSLKSGQEATTNTLPIYFTLNFDKPIDMSTLDSTVIANVGSAQDVQVKITHTQNNTEFEVMVFAASSTGTISLDLDIAKVKFQGSSESIVKPEAAVVTYGDSSKIFKLLDQFSPKDKQGSATFLAEYNGRTYYLSQGDLWSVNNSFGSAIQHTQGGALSVFSKYLILGSKIYLLAAASGNVYPMVYDLEAGTLESLGVKNPSGYTAYKDMYCGSAGTKCQISSTWAGPYFQKFSETEVLFVADDGVEVGLYKSAGTAATTTKIKKIDDTNKMDTVFYGVANGLVVFLHDTNPPSNNREVFVTDGTAIGTQALPGGVSIDGHNSYFGHSVINDKMYIYKTGAGAYYVDSYSAPTDDPNFETSVAYMDENVIINHNNEQIIHMNADQTNLVTIGTMKTLTSAVYKIGSFYYFTAYNSFNSADSRLYKTDGTSGNLTQLTSSRTYGIEKVIGSRIFLKHEEAATGTELYSYEEGSGLNLFLEFEPGSTNGFTGMKNPFELNGDHYFFRNNLLYKIDGATFATSVISLDSNWPSSFSLFKSSTGIFLEYTDQNHYKDLFFFNGNGFSKIADLDIGYNEMKFNYIGGSNGSLMFSAEDRRTGVENIWFSNGMVGELARSEFLKTSVRNFKGSAYFFATDTAGDGKFKLFKSDYSLVGTLDSGFGVGQNQDGSFKMGYFYEVTDNYLYFLSYDETSLDGALYRTDGTPAGTLRLIELPSSGIGKVKRDGPDGMLFSAYDAGGKYHLYYTDGSVGNSYRVSNSADLHYRMSAFVSDGSNIFYSSYDKVFKASYSAESGVEFINTGNSAHTGTDIGNLQVINDRLLYSSGWVFWDLYTSDKNVAGGVLLDMIGGSSNDFYFTEANNNDYDPPEVGLNTVLTDKNDKYYGTQGTNGTLQDLGVVGSGTWQKAGSFYYNTSVSGIIKSDFTLGGTSLITTYGGTFSVNFYNGTNHYSVDDTTSYFCTNSGTDSKLIKIQNDIITVLGTFELDSLNYGCGILGVYEGHILLSASSSATGREIWISNGSENSAKVIEDIVPGQGGSRPTLAKLSGNKLYVSTKDTYKSGVLWVGDWTQIKGL